MHRFRVLLRRPGRLSLARLLPLALVGIGACCLDVNGVTGGGSFPKEDGGCAFCTPGGGGDGDGVCVASCPPGGSPVSNDIPGSHCNFGPSCQTGLSDCGGSFPCLASDPSNCGNCGHSCGGGQQCVQALCGVDCGSGFTALEIDPHNCGSCGNVCPADQVCGAGVCGPPCSPTSAQCTNVIQSPLPDGGVSCATCPSCTLGFAPLSTCVDLTSDSNNCGGCGQVCGVGQICQDGNCEAACAAGEVCGAGTCQAECPTGTKLCTPATGGTGTCFDLQNDPRHCGNCDTVCDACIWGQCVYACAYYFDAGLNNH